MDDFERATALNLQIRASGPRALTEDEADLLYGSPTFVGLPDGRGSNLLHVLEGRWLTQRMRHPTAGRDDVWITSALAPLQTLLIHAELPLASGGRLACAEFFHPALVGPAGWVPSVAAGDLLGFRVIDGSVDVAAVESPTQSPSGEQRGRDLVSRHLRRADDWYDDGGGNNRRWALSQAIAGALLEDPAVLTDPWLPLDELLQDPCHDQHRFSWRDAAAAWQEGATSFSIQDMPEYLHVELNRRAARYGMQLDQFIIALLGHLAWRTPFAEDLGPWESWEPELDERPSGQQLRALPSA